MSTPGNFGATLPWLAPEMLDGGKATAARDVWAFGMTALVSLLPIFSTEPPQELFTCEDPFHPIHGNVPTMSRIIKGPPDRPSAEITCFRLTDEWWGICSECWHLDPPMRPTMKQVAKKIEQMVCPSPNAWLSAIDWCLKMSSLHPTVPNDVMHPNGPVTFPHHHNVYGH